MQGTASTLNSSKALLNGSDQLAKCFVHTVIPTGNERLSRSAADDRAPGLPGAVPVRRRPGRDRRRTSTATAATCGRRPAAAQTECATASLPGGGPLYGNAVFPSLATRPANPGKQPPLVRNIPCFKNAPPDLNAAQHRVGP